MLWWWLRKYMLRWLLFLLLRGEELIEMVLLGLVLRIGNRENWRATVIVHQLMMRMVLLMNLWCTITSWLHICILTDGGDKSMKT